MPAEKPANSNRKLRWYQFSLRSLFILTFLVAIASSWYAVKMGQARKQKEAVEALLKLGGSVEYDYERDSSGLPLLGATPPGPAWLRKLLGDDFFINLSSVSLNWGIATDADLKHLEWMNQLKHLELRHTQITDAGLEQLKGLKQLKWLDLSNTKVTDAGLEHLKGLKQLEVLYLVSTQVTDAGFEKINGLKQLWLLDFSNTKVTDAGLERLTDLKQIKRLTLGLESTQITDAGLEKLQGIQLQFLDLRKTLVTDAGVEKLKKTLPNLKIKH